MLDLMGIGLHLHMDILNNYMPKLLSADLVVIDGKVYKDRTGKHEGKDAMIAMVLEMMAVPQGKKMDDVVKIERLEGCTIMTYNNESGKIVLISTQPITFTQIK